MIYKVQWRLLLGVLLCVSCQNVNVATTEAPEASWRKQADDLSENTVIAGFTNSILMSKSGELY